MKKAKHILIFILFISIANCSSDDNENNEELFKVDIEGITHDFSSIPTLSEIVNNSQMTIYRVSEQGETLKLNIGNYRLDNKLTETNYLIGNGNCSINESISYDTGILNTPEIAQGFVTDRFDNNYVGEINLTKLDTINDLVSGTFSGNLTGMNSNGELFYKELTNGIFENIQLFSFNQDIEPSLVTANVDSFCFVSQIIGAERFNQVEDYIFIGAYNSGFGRLELRIPSDSNVGIQSFNNQSFFGISFENFITDSIYPKFDSSNFSISIHDKDLNYIEGTFSIMDSFHTITEGSFKSYYEDFID